MLMLGTVPTATPTGETTGWATTTGTCTTTGTWDTTTGTDPVTRETRNIYPGLS